MKSIVKVETKRILKTESLMAFFCCCPNIVDKQQLSGGKEL